MVTWAVMPFSLSPSIGGKGRVVFLFRWNFMGRNLFSIRTGVLHSVWKRACVGVQGVKIANTCVYRNLVCFSAKKRGVYR